MKTISIVSEIPQGLSVTKMHASGDVLFLTATDDRNVNHLLSAPMPPEPRAASPLTMVATPDFLQVVDVRDNHALLQLKPIGDEQVLTRQACVVNVESGDIKNFSFPKSARPLRLSRDGQSIFLLVCCSGRFTAYSGGSEGCAPMVGQNEAIFEVWRLGEGSSIGVTCTFSNVGKRQIEQTAVYADFLAIVTSDGGRPGGNEVVVLSLSEASTGEVDYNTLPRFDASQIVLAGSGRYSAYGSVMTEEGWVAAKFSVIMTILLGSSTVPRVVAESPNGTITIVEAEHNGIASLDFYLGLSTHPIKDFITNWPAVNALPSLGTLLVGPAAIGPLNEIFMIARSGVNQYLVHVF